MINLEDYDQIGKRRVEKLFNLGVTVYAFVYRDNDYGIGKGMYNMKKVAPIYRMAMMDLMDQETVFFLTKKGE